MIELFTKEEFYNHSKKHSCIILFSAPWCGPCKRQKPILENFEYKDYEKFYVNVEDQYELADELSILSVPTIQVYNNGILQTTINGLQTEKELEKIFTEIA